MYECRFRSTSFRQVQDSSSTGRFALPSGEGLVEEHGAVESVSLDRAETRVADDLADLFFRGGVWAMSLEDAACVVAAEAQANLQDFEALSFEAGLDVSDVVEVEARDGEGFEVLDGGGLFEAGHGSGARDEAPWGEGTEAAGVVLQTVQGFEVVEAVLDGFAAAEYHGRGGLDSEGVGGAVDG